MSSLQFKNYLKNYSKQLLASSLVWFIGMLLVGYAISNSAAPDQLSELRYIPVYAVAFLSTLCVGLCHYLYWQDAAAH
ncbi:MAG: hypothetical protein VYB38_00785 [Bacteroidota bacterium]|nr:hypothetical protein [Bacteroidota bacterium]MEC8884135.1 hypothetical protein [Bacteroidota bacterium]MEE3226462.1 hypothetical protein [Bacteroidota bacterium]